MNWKNLLIISAAIGILLLVFIPFIMQPERVYKETNLLIIIGFLGFSLISSYPHILPRNKQGEISLVGRNSVTALILILIILGVFIYRPYIESCKPLVNLMPSIFTALFMNYFALIIWFKLKRINSKMPFDLIHTIILIAVVGSNVLWLAQSYDYILFNVQQLNQCF